MILRENYMLSNGVRIPKLGLGTWMIGTQEAAEAIRQAVSLGYRHFDTAQAYGNEAGVGEGIRSCGLARDKLYVTSKVAAEVKSYAAAAQSIDETLCRMKLDYIDLMLIHSPQPWGEWHADKRYFKENRDVWRALEDAVMAGKVRSIGVSNFFIDDLENILAECRIPPAVNQILMHIGNTDTELIDFCQTRNILIEAYSPIAHGMALKSPEITAMAEKYNVSAAQLCIRYILEMGAAPLPKTKNPRHMSDNAQVDFTMALDDVEKLKAMKSIVNYQKLSCFPVFSGK